MSQTHIVDGRIDHRPGVSGDTEPMTGPPPDPDEFREFMSHWPTGVSVVTSRLGNRPAGCTVNAVMSVSLSPPLLVISLGHDSGTLAAIERTGAFAINVLSADQRDLCGRFARGEQSDRFRGVPVQYLRDVPVLCDSLATAICTVRGATRCGDHVLVVGMPVWQNARPKAGPPLVFHDHHLLGLPTTDAGEG